jgi:hypothetical protein
MVTRYHLTTSSPPVLRPLLIQFETKALMCHLEIKYCESLLEVISRNQHTISYNYSLSVLHTNGEKCFRKCMNRINSSHSRVRYIMHKVLCFSVPINSFHENSMQIMFSPRSVVLIVTTLVAGRPRKRSSIPGRTKYFSVLQNTRTTSRKC